LRREEALEFVKERVKDDRLFKHMLAVEALMRACARRLGEDEELWGLVGLLHDVDYEATKDDPKRHGLVSADLLKGLLPEDALDAIRAHNELTGFKCESRLAKALKACDQLSGLIVATALVMPSKRLREVKPKSLLRKFKQKDFARRVERDKIALCEELGMGLEEFLSLGLDALNGISRALGL